MPIAFDCSCGRKLRLQDALAGKKIRCPECSSVLSVPKPSKPRSARPKSPARSRTARSTRRPTKQRPRRTRAVEPELHEDFDDRDDDAPRPRRKPRRKRKQGLPIWVPISAAALGLALVVTVIIAISSPNRTPEVAANISDTDSTATNGTARPNWIGHDTHLGPVGCPVFISDNSVISVADGKTLRKLQQPIDEQADVRLSPNGRFAAAARTEHPSGITVWNLSTGRVAFTVPNNVGQIVDVLSLSESHLLFGGRKSQQLQKWELTSGDPANDITVPIKRVVDLSISGDGRLAAFENSKNAVLFNLGNGSTTTLTQPPKLSPLQPTSSDRSTSFGSVTFSRQCFSPDGTQVAVDSADRITCWDTDGRITFDSRIYAGWFGSGDHLTWLPDNSGWLANRMIVDREAKLPIVVIRPGQASHFQPQMLDDTRVMTGLPENSSKTWNSIGVFEIPFERLRATLKDLKNDNVYLKPGMTVSFESDFSLIPANSKWLEHSNTQWPILLKKNGLNVLPGQTTIFRYRYVRPSSSLKPIRSERLTSNGGALIKGKTDMVIAVAELLVDGELVWRSLGREIQAESFRYYMQDSNHTNRVAQAAEFSLPIVVSKNGGNPSLPAVIN